MCTGAYCICVAIVGTMCLAITDNVYFDAKSVQIIIKPFNDHLGYLDPYFNRLSSNGYNLQVLWVKTWDQSHSVLHEVAFKSI